MYGESFFWKKFAFLQQLIFFSECFQLKYSRNLLGSKYDLIMVTFSSWLIHVSSQSLQILTSIWFYFLENDQFWNKMYCVFWCKIALLSASFVFSRKSNMVCWRDIIIPRQRDTVYAISILTIPTLRVLSLTVLQKGNVAKFLLQENQVFMRDCYMNVT